MIVKILLEDSGFEYEVHSKESVMIENKFTFVYRADGNTTIISNDIIKIIEFVNDPT